MVNVGNFPLKRTASSKSRNLLGACLTHILHDGYTDQLYALLPRGRHSSACPIWGSPWFVRSTTARWADFRFRPIALPVA